MKFNKGDAVRCSTPGESCDGMLGVVFSDGPRDTNIIVDLADGSHWRFDRWELELVTNNEGK